VGGALEYPKLLAYATGVLEKNANEVRLIDAVAQRWDKQKVLQDVLEFAPKLIVV